MTGHLADMATAAWAIRWHLTALVGVVAYVIAAEAVQRRRWRERGAR